MIFDIADKSGREDLEINPKNHSLHSPIVCPPHGYGSMADNKKIPSFSFWNLNDLNYELGFLLFCDRSHRGRF